MSATADDQQPGGYCMTSILRRMRHILRAVMLSAGLVLTACYPFLPGGYDKAARTLSMMVQLALALGVLFLAPIGAAWWVGERRSLGSAPGDRVLVQRRYGRAAVIAASVVAVIVSLAAWADGALSLMAIALAAAGLWLRRAWRAIAHPNAARVDTRTHPAPVYLTLVPALGVVVIVTLIHPLKDFSRDRAMTAAEPLIAAIERHREQHGQYPETLGALWPDFLVGIVGVDQFRYARHGAAYTLSFEQPRFLVDRPGTQEVVVYNPSGEHLFPSHVAWLVESPVDFVRRRQGWYESIDGPRSHWKSFLFD